MKLIIIYGAPAVGKLTTANLLSEKTGYPVLDNHTTIDLAVKHFPFGSKSFVQLIQKMRLDIIKESLAKNAPGLIYTSGYPNHPDAHSFYQELETIMTESNSTINYVKLICDPEEQENRVVSEERREREKITSIDQLRKAMQNLDFSTLTSSDKTLIIDNTHLSVQESVSKILDFFSLDEKGQELKKREEII